MGDPPSHGRFVRKPESTFQEPLLTSVAGRSYVRSLLFEVSPWSDVVHGRALSRGRSDPLANAGGDAEPGARFA